MGPARHAGRAGPGRGETRGCAKYLSAADVHTALAQPRGGLDLVPHALVDLDVQVLAGGVAGAALVGERGAGDDGLAGRDHDVGGVGVVAQVAVAVVDDHRDAVTGVEPAGGDDGAGADGADLGAGVAGEVHTLVLGAPARAEAG